MRRRWRLGWRAALLATPVAMCAVGLALSTAHLSNRLTHPAGYEHPGPMGTLQPTDETVGIDPQSDFGYPFSDVTFPTDGQANLRGWLVPGAGNARLGIVTAHGRGADRRDFLRHVAVFHQLGVPTLLFDYREHGISDGARRGMGMGLREAEDISAAVRFMKQTLGLERVVVVGGSLGASSAILAASRDPAIDGVVAESPFASLEAFLDHQLEQQMARRSVLRHLPRPHWLPRLTTQFTAWRQGIHDLEAPRDVVAQIAPRPLLLLHGTGDEALEPIHSQELYGRAGAPKELWIADDAEHMRVFDRYPEEYRARIATFLISVAPE